jgi:hypothetical protein
MHLTPQLPVSMWYNNVDTMMNCNQAGMLAGCCLDSQVGAAHAPDSTVACRHVTKQCKDCSWKAPGRACRHAFEHDATRGWIGGRRGCRSEVCEQAAVLVVRWGQLIT